MFSVDDTVMTHNIALQFPKIVTTQMLVGISFFT